MSRSIVISERDNIAAVLEDGRVAEFFIHRGDMLLGDVYLASVENILPSIDAAFVNLGGDRMGFLHASDVTGRGPLKDRLQPKQQLLVQIMKEPTGHKGPRVTTSISLPGRFLVFMPDEKGISVSRKIVSPKERGRLKSIVSLLKPAGVGVIIRTEAENQSEAEIQEDLELLLERWNNIVTAADTVTPPNLLYRDQDLLYRVIREACTEQVKEIILDTPFALHRTNQLLQSWNMGNDINVSVYKGSEPLLVSKGIDKEIRQALQTKVNLPSGGYLYIQTTEALTVVDVNSGKFTSSATQGETIRKTNLEAVSEIARQLRLRNIGGMIIIDFIDMENRVDQLAVLEELEAVLEPDKAKPQVGQLSDLGLVELTRHRQGQSLAEIFTKRCPACSGSGAIVEEFNFAAPPQEGEFGRTRVQKLRMPQKLARPQQNTNGSNNVNNKQNQNQNQNQHQNQNQKQKQNINQIINKEDKQISERKINTSPSMVASVNQKPKKVETSDTQLSDMTDETIKQLLSNKGHVPAISKVIRFAAIPPKVARENMTNHYIVDVFTILQELESAEQSSLSSQQQAVIPNQIKKPPIHKDNRILNRKPESNINRNVPKDEITVNKSTALVDNVTDTKSSEQPLDSININLNKAVDEKLDHLDNQEIPVVVDPVVNAKDDKPVELSDNTEDKQTEAPKKVVRRGRKPKSETSSAPGTTKRRSTVRAKKPSPKKED